MSREIVLKLALKWIEWSGFQVEYGRMDDKTCKTEQRSWIDSGRIWSFLAFWTLITDQSDKLMAD